MEVQRYFCLIRTILIYIVVFFCCLWGGRSFSQPQAVSCATVVSRINELGRLVTTNAEFSNSRKHHHLFQLYRIQFFGNKDTSRSLEDVMDVTMKYPRLSKPALREQIVTLEQRDYESSQILRDVVQRLKNSADQFQAQLFQPEANLGFWQRLLMPLRKEDLAGLSKQERKAKQKEHRAQFVKYFNQILSRTDLAILKNNFMNHQDKTTLVYWILNKIRLQMIEEGKEVQSISQAMVDLVHTSGFRNPHYMTLLKSQNALDQIRGLEYILDERDMIAIQLNFLGHFSELAHSLNIDYPTGSSKKENLSQTLSDIQQEIQNSPYTVAGNQVFKVRALSLQESPFRGCLGGSDCSTDQYFDLGFDPNFIYFTLTDTGLKSSGQITVVLGTAYSEKENNLIKIAFVDKIQNVQQVMILPMLEAVRLSLEEQGYRLSLPVNVGGHNGISNMQTIGAYIDSEVNPLFTHSLRDFKPHEHLYDFDRGYSKAYSKPVILEFEKQEGAFKIESGEIHTRSKISTELKTEDVFKEVLSWKDSQKEEEQIKFMSQLKLLIDVKELNLSQNFAENYLKSKIKDKQISFKVRKYALYVLLEIRLREYDRRVKVEKFDIEGFKNVLEFFSEQEQLKVLGEMSNWKNSSNRMRALFIRKFSSIVIEDFIVKDILNSPLRLIFNVHYRDRFGETVMFTAVRKRDKEMVELLEKKGIKLSDKNDAGETVMFTAVREGDTEMVEFLEEKGIELNDKNDAGETVVFTAVREGNKQMVEFLEEKGVDIYEVNDAGETILFVAKKMNDPEMEEFLKANMK